MCIGGMHRSIIDVGSMKGHQHLEAEAAPKIWSRSHHWLIEQYYPFYERKGTIRRTPKLL